MSSALPDSWYTATFGELNLYVSKTLDPAKFPSEEFELYSVPSYPVGVPEIVLGSEIGSSKQEVEPGDVLVCKINPRINRVWQVLPKTERRQIASSEWIVMRPGALNGKYLRYYFMGNEFRELICADVTGVGGSLTRAQPKRVAAFPVPIAPLSEQTRIADKLDALLARVDACRARLGRVSAVIKRFRQAVLAAAVEGRLTEDWREENPDTEPAQILLKRIRSTRLANQDRSRKFHANPDDTENSIPSLFYIPEQHLPTTWVATNIGTVGTVSNGSTPSRKVPSYWDGDIPWVGSGEVQNCIITVTRERISQEGYNSTLSNSGRVTHGIDQTSPNRGRE